MKRDRKVPLLRVVDTNLTSRASEQADQAPTTSDLLLPPVDWVFQYPWRVEHSVDGSIVLRWRDQAITFRPHEITPLIDALARAASALETSRRKCGGQS